MKMGYKIYRYFYDNFAVKTAWCSITIDILWLWLSKNITENLSFLDVITSDEAKFSLNLKFTSLNLVEYAEYASFHPDDYYMEYL